MPCEYYNSGSRQSRLSSCRQLIHEDQHVTIIERDSHRTKQVSNQLVCIDISDEGNNLEVFHQAGLDKADFFISITESD
ncbi:MAG: NAD-binding protein [Spirochaetales bacterium]|nr:NAD-binding protein [Spirochaetales bacterium]